jgi:membrane protein YqaA with SNARE-associated domain
MLSEQLFTLFSLSFLAATFLPLGSEAYFLFLLSEGIDPIFLVFVASFGNVLGSVFTYYIGVLGKLEWAGKYLKIPEGKVLSLKESIGKRGAILSFFCWLPIIGDPLAFALGYFKVSVKNFVPLMALGKVFRYGLLLLL